MNILINLMVISYSVVCVLTLMTVIECARRDDGRPVPLNAYWLPVEWPYRAIRFICRQSQVESRYADSWTKGSL